MTKNNYFYFAKKDLSRMLSKTVKQRSFYE